MTSPSTGSSRPARSARMQPSRIPLVVIGVVVAVVIVALIAALAAGGDDDGGDDSGRSDGAPTADDGGTDAATTGTVTASGTPLPQLNDSADEPAVGMTLPTLTGTDQAGDPLTIAADGRPKMIVFVAHWCPHCQREVPIVQRWADGSGLPDGVDLVSVSTAIDANRPNYPPDRWLADEGWTAPVLVDGDSTAAQAAGLSAYPFFVAVDGEGTVVSRTSGELSTSQLDDIVAALVEGEP